MPDDTPSPTPPFDDELRETVELIPGARMILMEKTGHVHAVENPQAVNEALARHLEGFSNPG